MLRKEFQERALKGVLFPAVSEWIASYGVAIVNTPRGPDFILSLKLHESLKENRPCLIVMNVQNKEQAADFARELLIMETTTMSGEEIDKLLTIAVTARRALESEEGQKFIEGVLTYGTFETENLKGHTEVLPNDETIIELFTQDNS